MQLKKFEDLVEEANGIIASQVPLAVPRVSGILKFYELQAKFGGLSEHHGIYWILRAQLGTLDKLKVLLPEDRLPSSVEILAGCRNIFENLVWLKLFLIDQSWGLFFYGQFLQAHRQDLEGSIQKFKVEAELFEAFSAEDAAIFNDLVLEFPLIKESTSEDQIYFTKELSRRKRELDIRARRTFALFAEAATINGYSFQAHLLRTKHIPRLKEQLELIVRRIDRFKQEVGDESLTKVRTHKSG
ncbi:hypothetical protein FALB51S_01982 [Frigidibacter albus]